MAEVSDAPCSAKGCTDQAEWALLWNNPKIHTPERRKVWLACATHRESLTSFLGARDFLRDTVAYPDGLPPGTDADADPRQ